MNEAASSGPMIDCDAAAALMEPLTDLVIRAGAAIMAVNRGAMTDRGQGRTDRRSRKPISPPTASLARAWRG